MEPIEEQVLNTFFIFFILGFIFCILFNTSKFAKFPPNKFSEKKREVGGHSLAIFILEILFQREIKNVNQQI